VTQNYGGSFAQRLIDQGEFEQAIVVATREAAKDPKDPEPVFDRAVALSAQSRFIEATADFERALALDEEAQVLELDFVDDAVFGSLLGEARAKSTSDLNAALARLAHYAAVFPKGRHLGDIDRLARELRGEKDDSVIVKEREA